MGTVLRGDEWYGSGLYNRRFGDLYLYATRNVCPNTAARFMGSEILFVDGQSAYLVQVSSAPVEDPQI
jgi:hypothetical protein